LVNQLFTFCAFLRNLFSALIGVLLIWWTSLSWFSVTLIFNQLVAWETKNDLLNTLVYANIYRIIIRYYPFKTVRAVMNYRCFILYFLCLSNRFKRYTKTYFTLVLFPTFQVSSRLYRLVKFLPRRFKNKQVNE
jgi:hypothetical protein